MSVGERSGRKRISRIVRRCWPPPCTAESADTSTTLTGAALVIATLPAPKWPELISAGQGCCCAGTASDPGQLVSLVGGQRPCPPVDAEDAVLGLSTGDDRLGPLDWSDDRADEGSYDVLSLT